MKNEPLVSIVIVNWNGLAVIEDCLKSLKEINYSEKELILVDNNSSDQSIEVAQKYKKLFKRFILIKNKKNLGFALANNQGFERARGKYMLLLNNDTKVEPSFLKKLVRRMEMDSNIGVIQPKIYLMDNDGYLDNAGSYLTKIGFLKHWGFMERDGAEFSKEKLIFSAKGACMLIRRSVIEKIGLFDPDFHSYFEESDFCWRVWLSGNKVLFYPQAVISHKLGFTIKRLDVTDLNFHYYKNRICSLLKNLSRKYFLTVLTAHILISLGLVVLFSIKLQFKNSFMIIKALMWNLDNLNSTLKKRKIIQQQRKIDDDVLFKVLSKPIILSAYWKDLKRVTEDMGK